MIDNEQRLRSAERFANIRRILLVINALAYVIWIGAQSLYFFDGITATNQQVATIQRIAGPIWFVSLLAICFMMYRLSYRRDLQALVDDERTKDIQRRAYQVGYFTLLISVGIAYALCFIGHTPNVLALLPILLSLGIAVPPLTHALLYWS